MVSRPAQFYTPELLLLDIHSRVVANRASGRGLTDDESAALQSAFHYFRVGGQRHTADEKKPLFLRLRAESTFGDFDELGGLDNDHRIANNLESASVPTRQSQPMSHLKGRIGTETPFASMILRSPQHQL